MYNFTSSQYKPFDFVALTETWIDDGVDSGELFPASYTVFRADRCRSVVGLSRGGGALLAVESSLEAQQLDLRGLCPQLNSIPLIDIVGVKVVYNRHSVDLFVIYIPPRVTTDQVSAFFDAFEDLIMDRGRECLIVGDFNVTRYADSLSQSVSERNVCRLLRLCRLLGLQQFNFVRNSNGRILDLVLSNANCCVEIAEDVMVEQDVHHPALYVKFDGYKSPSPLLCNRSRNTPLAYNFRRADFVSLYQYLSESTWETVLSQNDVNIAVGNFYNNIYSAFDRFVPKTRPHTGRSYPPWFTKDIISKIRLKYKNWRLYRNTGDMRAYQRFKELRSNLKIAIRNSHAAFVRRTEEEINSDPKKFWSFLNHKTRRSQFPNTVNYEDNNYSNISDILNSFASHFSKDYTDKNCSQLDLQESISSSLTFSSETLSIADFSESLILDGFKAVKTNLSSGPDCVPGIIVVDCRFSFLVPLKHIFSLILKSSCFPDVWKISRIVPIFKKGNRSDVSNYRPVAILNNFSKIFEFCLYRPLLEHVRDRLSEHQHGFLPGRSTTSNLFVITQFISDHLDKSSQVDVVYTDFSKAFDRLDHRLLLSKIRHFCISDDLIRLIGSYLAKRRQFVGNGSVRSSDFLVRSGVPQGSILGPLFFSMFINDVTSLLSVRYLLYADDMKLFCPIKSVGDCFRLQDDLDILQQWCVNNHLPLNVQKCNIMSYHLIKNPVLFSYSIGGEILSRPEVIHDLGVTFDPGLTFVTHINTIINKSFKCMGFVMRNGKGFSAATLLRLFNIYIRSRLEYACVVWSPTYAVHIQELEIILRKFLKYLSYIQDGVYPEIGYPQEALRRRFGVESLELRRQYHSVMFLRKIVKGHIDCPSISAQLTYSIPRSGARHQTLFYLPFARTRLQQSSPLHTMCNNYHSVQSHLDLFSATDSEIRSVLFSNA